MTDELGSISPHRSRATARRGEEFDGDRRETSGTGGGATGGAATPLATGSRRRRDRRAGGGTAGVITAGTGPHPHAG